MPDTTIDPEQLHWYKDAIIYELHIKAFCDGNGDGIGDFKGLISKLDYLQSLGVTALWILPFYPSPLKDDGYDISDYYSINPSYGNIGQFKQLLAEAHQRNLKVITELVINHTSDRHAWFQRARRAPKGSPERDFYVWTDNPHQFREVRIIFQDFEASNWTWDPVAQQYYWHRFFHHQPDLNYDNPLVEQEIFRILDYWCAMGVDGFRLDAVPYLFEREGTNCENLPETHAFLKKLRKHVDTYYPGTLLLAEANMWPEDSAAYFGKGDECHMNYHFPVMPRMFMSLQMEDRYPITDIFEQTPAIPDSCQWAIFLRNHDELTLEMVTDEERDYMYKVYTKDPRARINLGIRHRLAPLLDNNRKKIELLNYLLFSLPGTPVIYYGDEIGMGDNFYLGDRDGVRTPMQWSADRNAGFSASEPFRLYLPVINDPSYHYESVNVDAQHKNTASLLWWMRRIINTRKKYKAFGRGNMNFLPVENPKVLAFTRTYEDQNILVLANLSRYLQPVELDLKDFAGCKPVELFSRKKFPGVKAGSPYLFSLAPHDCQWFLLENAESGSAARTQEELPVLHVAAWHDLLRRRALELLENEILPAYLLNMRWYGGKGRAMQALKIIDRALISGEQENAAIVLIEVSYESGFAETYQLPLAFTDEASAQALREHWPKALIAPMQLGEKKGWLYDAAFSDHFRLELFNGMANGKNLPQDNSELNFSGSSALKEYVAAHDEIHSKILSAEQSNTSLTYNNNFFLKLYRKVDRAVNPDLELTRFLTENAGFKNIPAYTGHIEWQFANGAMVLGMMQEMVQSNGDAWSYMQDKLEQYYEKAGAIGQQPLPVNESFIHAPAYENIPAAMKELLDASIAEQAGLLGKRTGQMHLALASDSDLAGFKPEEFSLHYQRSLYSGFQSLVRATFEGQVKNLSKLPEEIRTEAEKVLSLKAGILQLLKRIYRKKINTVKIRIHGDYHLGQVLVTGRDFVILDFEGEPARTYSERRLKRSALRDVAGMVRSFHYAAYASLILNDKITPEDRLKLMPFAEQWYHYMSGFFIKAYLETVKDSMLVPQETEDLEILLQTYILEKAIYELGYELNNRPGWVLIPLRGILSIMNGQDNDNA